MVGETCTGVVTGAAAGELAQQAGLPGPGPRGDLLQSHHRVDQLGVGQRGGVGGGVGEFPRPQRDGHGQVGEVVGGGVVAAGVVEDGAAERHLVAPVALDHVFDFTIVSSSGQLSCLRTSGTLWVFVVVTPPRARLPR